MRDPQILESVKATLALLVAANPGRAIEVRIPPYAAVQCGIEMDADTWLALANGKTNWAAAMQTGKINASGARADLSEYLPLAPIRITP